MGEENGCIKLLLFSTRLKIIASILLTLGDNNDQETSPRTHQHPAWDRVHPSRPTAFPLLQVLPSVPGKSPRFENPMCKTLDARNMEEKIVESNRVEMEEFARDFEESSSIVF